VSDLRLPTLNKVLIAGRCTRDPEVRYIQSGTAVTTLGVASSRAYKDPKDPSGPWKEETCFINVVAWAQLAERCGDSLKKGSAVLVEGRLQSRSWETDEGQKRTVIEVRADRIQFLDRRGESAPARPSPRGRRIKAPCPRTIFRSRERSQPSGHPRPDAGGVRSSQGE
jgi:single-strand DNA-binding protein